MEITRFGGDTETIGGHIQLALFLTSQVLLDPLNEPLVRERGIE